MDIFGIKRRRLQNKVLVKFLEARTALHVANIKLVSMHVKLFQQGKPFYEKEESERLRKSFDQFEAERTVSQNSVAHLKNRLARLQRS